MRRLICVVWLMMGIVEPPRQNPGYKPPPLPTPVVSGSAWIHHSRPSANGYYLHGQRLGWPLS